MTMLPLALLALVSAASPAPPRATYAVVVANNHPMPGQDELPVLRYADDDGARFYELFELFAKRVEVHAVLDAESQAVHANVAKVARPPTRRSIAESLQAVFADIRAARAAGARTELFFVFVGHGSALESGEGVMHLLDGGFTRSDLFQEVVSRSPADTNHVLIDACNAFLFVAGRGDGGDAASIDAAVDQYLARETMQRHPNTGFLLSTSASAEVHEWSGFRAGVFSHEVRSAMIGGADIDADGAVTYDEVRAFVNAANGRVTDPRARLSPWVAPPAIRRATPLIDRARTPRRVSTVHVPGALAGRWSIEDSRGVRLADVNVAPDGPVTLTLSAERDHVLRGPQEEIPLPSTVASALDARRLSRRERAVQARGLDRSFREGLFALPFGRAFFDGFTAANPPASLAITDRAPDEPSTTKYWVGGSMVAVAVALVATGVYFGALAKDDAERYRSGAGLPSELDGVRDRAQDRQTAANTLYGVGAAVGVGGLFVMTW